VMIARLAEKDCSELSRLHNAVRCNQEMHWNLGGIEHCDDSDISNQVCCTKCNGLYILIVEGYQERNLATHKETILHQFDRGNELLTKDGFSEGTQWLRGRDDQSAQHLLVHSFTNQIEAHSPENRRSWGRNYCGEKLCCRRMGLKTRQASFLLRGALVCSIGLV